MRQAKTLLLLLLMINCCAAFAADCPPSGPAIAETLHAGDSTSGNFVATALRWYDAHMNYGAVCMLMTVESSFIPFPSEVVIPPAVYVAANPDSASGMNIWLILLIGTLGALLGAFINYYLSRWLGRPVIYAFADSKLGHLLSLSREKVERAEDYFNRHGNMSTLVGRLIPVIRQLISIPAGLSKMHVGAFALYTFLGALVWNSVLTALGYIAYRAAKPDLIEQYSHQISIGIVALCCVAAALFVFRLLWKKRKQQKSNTTV
ncbi:MAG: hypothetical protein AUK63_1330 [bacterium P3]|nr:MAG: hypothetical protein AUK63_1330 [bacterium P3]KWW40438.1 MAG: hypothetical protein F083_1675 [bacterium F083]